jgi:late competence protein required for DNA uptake (superfamily II DNA/RNA helicase)
MGANQGNVGHDLTATHPDVVHSSGSKDFVSLQKRNSEKGKRKCKRCPTKLADSNSNKLYCWKCEQLLRLDRISSVTTRYVNSDDMDFDK